MNTVRLKFLAPMVAALLLINGISVVNAAASNSFIACVKSSGEIRLLVKGKKCSKSEKQTQVTLTKKARSSFIGPKGETGTQGPIGAQGPIGPKGEVGATGPAGVKGDTGPQGATGASGANGATGVKGSSVLTGVGAPSNSLGENGDTYIDKNAAMIYGPKTNGLWGNPTSFGGPAGGQGPAGPAGATGPTGPTGASGANGLGLMNDLPTSFQQLFAIDETGFGCCDLPNSKLKILVQFRNVSGFTISGLGSNNVSEYSTQLWMQYYDANGQLIYVNGSYAFTHNGYGAVETSNWNGGANWLNEQDKEWLIDIDDVYMDKPSQAKYVAIYFRLMNLKLIGTSANTPPLVGGSTQRLDSKDLLIIRFSAWPFSD